MVRDPVRTDVDCTLCHTGRDDLGGRNTGEKKDEKNKPHGRQKPYHLELLFGGREKSGRDFSEIMLCYVSKSGGLSGVIGVIHPKTGTLSSLVPTIRAPGVICGNSAFPKFGGHVCTVVFF